MPADHAGVVGDRAVGERVVGLLGIAAALEEEQQPLVPGRLAGRRAPGRCAGRCCGQISAQTSRAGRPSAHGMLRPERHRRVGVVVEEREVRSPAHPHREARREHDADGRAEALRPRFRFANRCARPIVGPHQPGHFRVAGKQAIVGIECHRCADQYYSQRRTRRSSVRFLRQRVIAEFPPATCRCRRRR